MARTRNFRRGLLTALGALLALWAVHAKAAAPVWGGETPALPASLSSSTTAATLTLGASGANSILFVTIDAPVNFSAPTISYNNLSMTPLGPVVSYNGSATIFRQVYYITNPVSAKTLSIASGAPTSLKNGGG